MVISVFAIKRQHVHQLKAADALEYVIIWVLCVFARLLFVWGFVFVFCIVGAYACPRTGCTAKMLIPATLKMHGMGRHPFLFSSVQFKMVSMRSESPKALHPSLRSFPNIPFETVPMFVWLTMALSRNFKKNRLALPLFTPLSSRRSVVWCPWLSFLLPMLISLLYLHPHILEHLAVW